VKATLKKGEGGARVNAGGKARYSEAGLTGKIDGGEGRSEVRQCT